MQKSVEQFAALNKSGLDAALGAWEIAFSGAEKWSRLNIEASKALLAEAVQQTQAMAGVRTVDEFTAFGTGAASVSVDRTLDYTRHCRHIAAESQAEAVKWIKSATDEVKTSVTQAIEGLTNVAPAPSKDAAFAAMQGASAWTDSIVEAAKQVVQHSNEFADATLSATAEVVKNARSKKV